MICVICKEGITAPGATTVTLERDGVIIAVKGVPADVCQNCGEYYLGSEVTRKVMEEAQAAVARHAEIEVLQYAA